MKALPLWQPWASLVAIGAKRVETRSWPAWDSLVGERVAIHATRTRAHLHLLEQSPFDSYGLDVNRLPLGALVASAVVERCAEITDELRVWLERRTPDEVAFGDYTTGRFAWILRDVEPLAEPITFIGRQGVFDVPDELLGYAPRQGALL